MKTLALPLTLLLASCAHWQASPSNPPDSVRVVDLAMCGSRAPLVADMLVDGRPALAELRALVSGAVDALRAGEQPTTAQMLALSQVRDTLDEIAGCI